ncbi:MAG: hypothetical protein R2818_03635 [Flavobacteriales bacterium]
MKALFSALALAGTLVAQAQEPVYRWGPPATNDFPERRIEQLLELGDQGFVLLRVAEDATTVKHYWLERYDNTLKHLGTQEVFFQGGVMGDAYFLDEVIAVNGVIHAFVTHWNKAAGTNTLLAHTLGFDGVLSEGKELDVIKAEKMGNSGTYTRALSPDGSKLLVLAELPYEKGTKESVRMSCFELPDLSLAWKHEQALDWDADKGLHNDIAVSNSGRAYLFKKTWQKPVWQYALYATDGKGSWKAHRSTQLEGKEIEDHRIMIGPDGACFVYALYTTQPSAYDKKVHGSWYARFAADGSLTVDRAEGWPMDMVASMSGERIAADAAKSHIDDLRIKDILFRSDAMPLVLLEQVESTSKMVAGSSPIQFTYEWKYGNAVAICLDPVSGAPLWWQSVDKRQEARSNVDQDEFGSFVYTLKADRLYVLWNNTDLSVPSIPAANWTEPDGTNYVKHKAFDTKTMHATFMEVIDPNGQLAYGDRTFGLPLFHMHEGAVFEMSMTTPFFFILNGDLVILAMMHNGGKRYRFGFIGL